MSSFHDKPESRQPAFERALAFKAYEIEELADVYFFRPIGAVVAHASRPVGISPNALTVLGGIVGAIGGALLYDESFGVLAFVLLILHGVIDSADGQLARLTNRTSELGRILDGMGGYATHAAAYLAIAAGHVARGGHPSIWFWTVAAGICTALQAQMYDYHRTLYATVVARQLAPQRWMTSPAVPAWARVIARAYDAVQRSLIGAHAGVENVLRSRAANGMNGQVTEDDRQRYRRCFYWPVRGWNLLGDNTRFYAIGVLVLLHHVDWFFFFILGPMNVALVVLWLWQQRADRRFLNEAVVG
jgi:phosphatidylglycerophosphate synthase